MWHVGSSWKQLYFRAKWLEGSDFYLGCCSSCNNKWHRYLTALFGLGIRYIIHHWVAKNEITLIYIVFAWTKAWITKINIGSAREIPLFCSSCPNSAADRLRKYHISEIIAGMNESVCEYSWLYKTSSVLYWLRSCWAVKMHDTPPQLKVHMCVEGKETCR